MHDIHDMNGLTLKVQYLHQKHTQVKQNTTTLTFKAHFQLNFFSCLVLKSFCKKSNLSSIHYNMLARLCKCVI